MIDCIITGKLVCLFGDEVLELSKRSSKLFDGLIRGCRIIIHQSSLNYHISLIYYFPVAASDSH